MSSTSESELKEGAPTPEHHYLHSFALAREHGRRLLQFVHPHTGKTLHICPSPEEVEKRRTELLREKSHEEFDVILHGSPDHLQALRDLHAHHESKRDELKARHGNIYTDVEHVKSELDALSAELHHLTNHAVALDASFDKFGYSAHLRTKDDDSETASRHSEHDVGKHLDRSVEALKFFRRPTIRQYFHKGLLWRSSESGEVASFELFIDLIYVGVIDIIGEKALEDPDGLSLLQFVIVFCIGWKIWSDLTMLINWFEIDDVFQRFSVVFYLVCLFGFTTNIAYFFESTYTSGVAFYVTQRLFSAVWCLGVGYFLPNIRGTMVTHSILVAISSAFWIGSIHVDWPDQLALIFLGLMVDLFGSLVPIWMMKSMGDDRPWRRFLKRHFEFYPAINIEHRVERTNAFVSLVFGYSVLTILFQSRSSFGINAFFGKGVLGLIQAFAFNWIYFEIDAYNVHVHAIRRHWFSSLMWINAHLPFIMAYILAAATLSQLVLAHDCANADPETLGSKYVEESAEHVSRALRWFYCGGLGVALISMSIISLSHVHKRLNKPRLRKRPRLVIRVCVAAIIICLPLADSLSSLSLVSITTALVIFVLFLDLFGNSCEGDRFWSGGFCAEEKRKCTYVANCKLSRHKRRQLKKALERGEKISVDDLLKRTGSVSSIESDGSRDLESYGGQF